jgi:hypothetical protein
MTSPGWLRPCSAADTEPQRGSSWVSLRHPISTGARQRVSFPTLSGPDLWSCDESRGAALRGNAALNPRFAEQLTSPPATESVSAGGSRGSEGDTNRHTHRLEKGRGTDAARVPGGGRERRDGSAGLRPHSPQPNARRFHPVGCTESHRPVDGHVRRAYPSFIFGHCPRRPLGDPSGSGISRSRV